MVNKSTTISQYHIAKLFTEVPEKQQAQQRPHQSCQLHCCNSLPNDSSRVRLTLMKSRLPSAPGEFCLNRPRPNTHRRSLTLSHAAPAGTAPTSPLQQRAATLVRRTWLGGRTPRRAAPRPAPPPSPPPRGSATTGRRNRHS